MSGLSDEVRRELVAAMVGHQRIPLYNGVGFNRCSGCDHLHSATDGANSPRHVAHQVDVAAPIIEALIHQAEARGAAAVVERVEAACVKAELLTQESMGRRSEHWRGIDYADGLDEGIEITTALVRDTAALTQDEQP